MKANQIYLHILLIISTANVFSQEFPDCSDLEVTHIEFINNNHDSLRVTVYNSCDSCIQNAYTGLIAYRNSDTLALNRCLSCRVSPPNNGERDYYLITKADFEIPEINKIQMLRVCDSIPFSHALNIDADKSRKLISYKLYQNYPNPFNPSTMISYQLPVSGNVKLAVYDILGREVATLIDSKQSAGSYIVAFSAENLANGFYFYRLQSGEFRSTKKMLLLK